MNSNNEPRKRVALLAVSALPLAGIFLSAGALSGCARRPIVVQTPAPTVVQTPAPAAPLTPTGREVIFLREAPPPLREETPPPPPSTEYRWIPGYWTARDGREEWVPGRYERPPRTTAVWVAPRWERRGEGYVFIEGYWR